MAHPITPASKFEYRIAPSVGGIRVGFGAFNHRRRSASRVMSLGRRRMSGKFEFRPTPGYGVQVAPSWPRLRFHTSTNLEATCPDVQLGRPAVSPGRRSRRAEIPPAIGEIKAIRRHADCGGRRRVFGGYVRRPTRRAGPRNIADTEMCDACNRLQPLDLHFARVV